EYIATRLNWANYEHDDLFRPAVGIEFGSYYLWEQLQTFGGYVHAALSGYNAGPGRAIAWRDAAGSDPDRFLDAITISSTRLYVQLIYRNYHIYRTLYGDQPS
ncbi:MAG TPA: transglycosylase SLT domain-containing protein, partial [Aggregatilineales bacterium]|nr:transglycosylase SLT domain-containing protein [Aggregatilineales bacterium]